MEKVTRTRGEAKGSFCSWLLLGVVTEGLAQLAKKLDVQPLAYTAHLERKLYTLLLAGILDYLPCPECETVEKAALCDVA